LLYSINEISISNYFGRKIMTTEFEAVMKTALQAMERGENLAMATVVQVRGSAPRHSGARMLVWPDGHIQGTIGGGTLEEKVIQHAREALQARHSRLEKYLFSTDNSPESVGLCGGEVLISIEVLEAPPRLVLIGAGHIALAMAQIGELIGMPVTIVDDRAEYLTDARFPPGSQQIHVPYDRQTELLDPIPLRWTPSMFVLVTTWGWDKPALQQVLLGETMPAYIGLVASRTKWRVIRQMLVESGVSEERLKQVHAPAGLDLGAETPGEISLAIMAEILQIRHLASATPMLSGRNTTDRKKGTHQ
jgi:xanthine dehydrogenase accessory factor